MYLQSRLGIPAFVLLSPLALAAAPLKIGDPVIFGEGGTYPRATRLSNGSLLGVYTRFAAGNSTITTVSSLDNGLTWSPLGRIDTGPSSTKDIDNGYVHQLTSGKILATFRNHDRGANPGEYTFYRITVCESDDSGKSWKYLSTPASDPAGPTGSWEPFFQTALDGSLQLYYSRENAANGQDSLLRRSTDEGKTWSDAQIISGAYVTARDGMVGVARLESQSPAKLAIFESGDPRFTIHTVRSDDDGKTWGGRALVYADEGGNAGAPQIILVGQRLVASFGTDGDGGDWPEGALKLVFSEDGGETWGDKMTVHAVPAFWGGLLALDDESFLALYESGGTSFAQRLSF